MRAIAPDEILLNDGSTIAVIDKLSAPKSATVAEVSCNVFRFDPDKHIVWRIQADEGTQERNPFVSLKVQEDGQLIAFRWDGGAYAVDVNTGNATYLYFAK